MAQARTRRRSVHGRGTQTEAVTRLEESGRSLQQVAADELGLHAHQLRRGWLAQPAAGGRLADTLAQQKAEAAERAGGRAGGRAGELAGAAPVPGDDRYAWRRGERDLCLAAAQRPD